MDKLDAMRLFARIVDRRSFTLAAQDLDLPRSTVTEVIKQLEARLGVRLLERTTRQVRPTLDGEAYYQRCLGILAEIEEAEAAFTGARPAGLLRVDVHSVLARHFMLPGLPDFLARYPGIQLRIGEGDRYVDLVREGVDCVLRVGKPGDSSMIGRQIALLPEGTYASPGYLERHGTPSAPDDLAGHHMVAFVSSATGSVLPLEFRHGETVREVLLPHTVSVAGAEMYAATARLGLGLIQVPSYRVQDDLARGTLVEVLKDFPPTPSPVYVLYPQNRQLSPRVRVFIDWLGAEFARRLPA
ncbi:DNA-binding transcriptional regulator, LysR family [Dyella jiangningensis]|uniref:LysR family transcriptional regulator n=1 Tax=Dyella sp. AtDHG13 TaxID=1938897 RepID=UPI00088DB993|nr:LysR family transcriptional regulator [Dyella sp. AtDHG13]PXV53697.1 LysR family transcriptional regulator [Dyella sp. AtDHG13]SDL20882.1 DNA-binding transcriptional regulator, LysR family [Dyella jiangningensis]